MFRNRGRSEIIPIDNLPKWQSNYFVYIHELVDKNVFNYSKNKYNYKK